MNRTIVSAFCIAVCSAILFPSPATASPIPVLLVDGQSGGPYHNWRLTTAVLKKELEETGLFQVTVATSPQFGGDFSSFQPKFGDYQAIVWNYDAPDWPAELRSQLEQYVRAGGGLVIVHAADNAFPDWLAYTQMTGIGITSAVSSPVYTPTTPGIERAADVSMLRSRACGRVLRRISACAMPGSVMSAT